MYYKIENDQVEKTTIEDWEKVTDGVALFTSDEWSRAVSIKADYILEKSQDNIHFCKLESYADFLFGTFHMPHKNSEGIKPGFAFYILQDKLIFIDNTDLVKLNMEKVLSNKLRKGYNIERFLYDLLLSLIDGDLQHLAELEKELTKMEERILAGKTENFNADMLELKKEISRLYRYYTQLVDLGEGLFENERDFFESSDKDLFHVFADRALRLQGETQILREYSMQVQEVYQSEIGIRQNDVMKILTVVTTIFLPLTLIVGWYGMNFEKMPELTWIYGYPMVIILSITVVVIGLWLFKRKKYL